MWTARVVALNLFWSRPHFCFQTNLRSHQNYYMSKYLFFLRHYTAYYHGRREDFFHGRAARAFFQNFSRGGQKWQNLFFSHSKLRKQRFLQKFKNPGAGSPVSRSDAHAYYVKWITDLQSFLKFIAMLNNIVNGSSALDAGYISVWFEVLV